VVKWSLSLVVAVIVIDPASTANMILDKSANQFEIYERRGVTD
jgi:hypothetical protein